VLWVNTIASLRAIPPEIATDRIDKNTYYYAQAAGEGVSR
jgi:hypothetical protein